MTRTIRTPGLSTIGLLAFVFSLAAHAQTPSPTATPAKNLPSSSSSLPSLPSVKATAQPIATSSLEKSSIGSPARPSGYRAAAPDEAARMLEDAVDLIEQESLDSTVTREELVEAALRGMVDHLNKRAVASGQPPVNAMLSRRDVARLSDSMAGQQAGIGILARASTEGIEVLHVFPESPAFKAGLQAGDRIVSVNDKAVASGGDAFSLLRGDEGAVKVSIAREAAPGTSQALDLKVGRGRYRVSPVVAHVFESHSEIGYLGIASFTRGTADDVFGDLLAFRESGVTGLVLDLRRNPGGSLEEAVKIAGMFVKPGTPVVQIIGKSGQPQILSADGEQIWASEKDGVRSEPLWLSVLVDGGTASAAEMLAAALQHDGAYLVGDRTAGKGIGESIFTLPGGGAMRLATGRYAAPDGSSWAGIGLIPLTRQVDPKDCEPFDPPVCIALQLKPRVNTVQKTTLDVTPASAAHR